VKTKEIGKKIINLILYSNLFIATCALFSILTTKLVILHTIKISPLEGLIFFSTLFIYALHRIIGVLRLEPFKGKGRYKIIAAYRSHISIYAVISGLGCIICAVLLPIETLLWFFFPALISLAYIIPFYKNKRLRDFNFIKIFLIAFIWTIVTVWIPLLHYGEAMEGNWFLLLEKFLFIFAITLPFDWRDVEVDRHLDVETIPSNLGETKTLLLIFFLFFIKNSLFFLLKIEYFFPFLMADLLSMIIVYFAIHKNKDVYYTLGVDGTMILQLLVLMLLI